MRDVGAPLDAPRPTAAARTAPTSHPSPVSNRLPRRRVEGRPWKKSGASRRRQPRRIGGYTWA
ncbi:hypothetical protein R1T08_02185 [Streptomyces sp. SBC-4]|nr:hypothetical protein [Streptomyces sp. SBC-4]MDV5143150.1 hypothetical protein [Streptomyces sp. SBC-4]